MNQPRPTVFDIAAEQIEMGNATFCCKALRLSAPNGQRQERKFLYDTLKPPHTWSSFWYGLIYKCDFNENMEGEDGYTFMQSQTARIMGLTLCAILLREDRKRRERNRLRRKNRK